MGAPPVVKCRVDGFERMGCVVEEVNGELLLMSSCWQSVGIQSCGSFFLCCGFCFLLKRFSWREINR